MDYYKMSQSAYNYIVKVLKGVNGPVQISSMVTILMSEYGLGRRFIVNQLKELQNDGMVKFHDEEVVEWIRPKLNQESSINESLSELDRKKLKELKELSQTQKANTSQ